MIILYTYYLQGGIASRIYFFLGAVGQGSGPDWRSSSRRPKWPCIWPKHIDVVLCVDDVLVQEIADDVLVQGIKQAIIFGLPGMVGLG